MKRAVPARRLERAPSSPKRLAADLAVSSARFASARLRAAPSTAASAIGQAGRRRAFRAVRRSIRRANAKSSLTRRAADRPVRR